MQKVSVKKLSVLGLVLMAASAVTAAILPASKENKQDLFSISAGVTNEANDNSTFSCAPTVLLESGDIQCQDASATGGAGTGSTSAFGDATSNATTLGA